MKNISVLILFLCICSVSVSAQSRKTIVVKAGTRVVDYFPDNERYTYPKFTNGHVRFNNGTDVEAKFNYDILMGEVLFLNKKDTLAIAKVKEINLVEIAGDTFFYDKGYLQVLAGKDSILLAVKQYVKLSDVAKEGAYGIKSNTGSIQTYNGVQVVGNNKSYKIMQNQDLILSRVTEYYIGNNVSGFLSYKKKNMMKLFPELKPDIENYLKQHPVNYNTKDDLIRLTGFLNTLQ